MYHASPHAMGFPCYKLIRSNTSNHANGLLGLWVAASADWIKPFGDQMYSLVVSGSVMDIGVGTLQKLRHDDEPDFYAEIRNMLLAKGVEYLRVMELDGQSHMGIVLNFEAIKSFELVVKPELIQHSRTMPKPGSPGSSCLPSP